MPSPACARKGRNGVPDQLQGREGVLGGREGTPISENPPRFCFTPVSASSLATLWKGDRGAWAGEPVCSQTASSERSFSHTRSAPAGGPTDPCLRSKQRPVTKSWRGPAATTAHRAPTPNITLTSPGFAAHPPQESAQQCEPSPSVRSGVYSRRRRVQNGGSQEPC